MSRGGRNLILLGIISVMVAMTTTGVSLAIYHQSGDIYLDRSRPGFLPDEEEIKDEEGKEDNYVFERTGEMTMGVLEEYLEEFDKVVRLIDGYTDAFGASALSDAKLGIAE